MRLIKFRAWNRERKVMGSAMPLDVLLLTAADDPTGPREELQYLEIMQFTGLHDKNGKEIYEGDIVRNRYGVLWEVCWYAQKYQWRFRRGTNTFTLNDKQFWSCSQNKRTKPSMEIIGNIYENPDLLSPGSSAD